MFSGKQLQKLGKRLRLGADPADVRMLNEYRRWFDPALLGCAFALNSALGDENPRYMLSGRAKRTKSIMRKLVREPTMDLSRMTDIVGLRIVVATTVDQSCIRDQLPQIIQIDRTTDYTGSEHFYRAVHLHGVFDNRRVELQVRTLAQQLWADESEAFGEQAKEGKLTVEQRSYLDELHDVVYAIDCSGKPETIHHPLAATRRPIEISLQALQRSFAEASQLQQGGHDRTLLVVHDEALNQITRQTVFGVDSRSEALAEYERLMNALEQTRFSVLLLNACNLKVLQVTHPRFFRGA